MAREERHLLPACGGKWPKRSEGRWGASLIEKTELCDFPSIPPAGYFPPASGEKRVLPAANSAKIPLWE